MNIFTHTHAHQDCFNYRKMKENPLIEIKRYEKGVILEGVSKSNGIAAVLEGTINFSFGGGYNQQINKEKMIVFPTKNKYMVEMVEDATFIIFRLDIDFSFCNHFSFEALYRGKKEKSKEFYTLNINSVIKNYLNNLTTLLKEEFYCGYLLEIKLKEFLYLLGYYYPMQKLKSFFAPLLCNDFKFSALIRKTYHPTLSVSELAEKTNYSISGFEKRFKKVFDIPPSQWLQYQKAQAIYHEINCSAKTFAELGYEFGFSSPSHFNNFCKKVFHDTPGNIRKKIINP